MTLELSIDIGKLQQKMKRLRPLANPCQRRLLTRLEFFISSKPRKTGEKLKIKKFPEKLLTLKLAGLKKELVFYFKIVRDSVGDSLELELLESFFIRKAKNEPKQRRSKKLPEPHELKVCLENCLNSGKLDQYWFILILFMSGRRGADVKRLDKNKMFRLGNYNWQVSVPFDKKNRKEIFFQLDFKVLDQNWCNMESTRCEAEFAQWLEVREGKIFDKVRIKNLASVTKTFTPHQLRSVRALLWTIEGSTDLEVMRKIGWSDARALATYRRLTGGQIRGRAREEGWRSINS